ncbi:hypothetical protein BLA29_004727 [Euroglyphus maynei]|uniref:Uncharacterized protein n=1 Tax=Euroglyphus maynei TaxID=6958 RepID=A0A1Y3BK62_EURMA|nr:hypothetical protein BLA29_004727 [Euroglyphus maynei]
MTSRICSARIHQRFLTCLDLVYRNLTNAYIKNRETFLFEMSDEFRPSLAFQHIGYDHFDSSRYMVIFVEQNLQLLSIKNQSENTTTIYQRHFQRRWQVYSFATMDRITNITHSAIVPDYLDEIPTEFELTGKNNDYDEYMIIVFNGTDHLYCMNEACSQSKKYQPFLTECRAPESLIELNQQSMNPKFQQQGLVVTKCCGQWEEYSKNQPNNNNNNNDDDDEWQIRKMKLNVMENYIVYDRHVQLI